MKVKYDKILNELREDDASLPPWGIQRVTLTTTNGTTQSILLIPMPDGSAISLTARVTALQTGGSAGNIGDFLGGQIVIRGGIDASNNLVGTVSSNYDVAAGCSFLSSASFLNTTNEAKIEVTGETNKTVFWICDYELNVQILP